MKVNISIDDISPHPYSSVRVLERCEELIEVFPDIKFTLFVPMAYWRTVKPGTTSNSPLNVSKFDDFCEEILDLDPNNYEIGYHGYYHGIPTVSDNDEFKSIGYESAIKKASEMKEEAKKAGLAKKIKNIFRPPAWRMSPEGFKALHDSGFTLFALTDLDYAMSTYAGSEKEYPSTFSNQFPPFRELKAEEKCGIVYHACEWDRNFLDSEKVESLVAFLQENNPEYVFIEDLL